jgi:hypothetical protein
VHYPQQPQAQQQEYWQQPVSQAGSRSQPPSPLGGGQGRFTTEQVLREQQRQERQEAEDRRKSRRDATRRRMRRRSASTRTRTSRCCRSAASRT